MTESKSTILAQKISIPILAQLHLLYMFRHVALVTMNVNVKREMIFEELSKSMQRTGMVASRDGMRHVGEKIQSNLLLAALFILWMKLRKLGTIQQDLTVL